MKGSHVYILSRNAHTSHTKFSSKPMDRSRRAQRFLKEKYKRISIIVCAVTIYYPWYNFLFNRLKEHTRTTKIIIRPNSIGSHGVSDKQIKVRNYPCT